MAQSNCASFGGHRCAGRYKKIEEEDKRFFEVKMLKRAAMLKAERLMFNSHSYEILALAFWEGSRQ